MQSHIRRVTILSIILGAVSAGLLAFPVLGTFHGREYGDVRFDGSVSKLPAYEHWEARNDWLGRAGLLLLALSTAGQIWIAFSESAAGVHSDHGPTLAPESTGSSHRAAPPAVGARGPVQRILSASDVVLFALVVIAGSWIMWRRPFGMATADTSTLAGTLFGAAALLLGNWINRWNEAKRQQRELAEKTRREQAELADKVTKLKALVTARLVHVASRLMSTKDLADAASNPHQLLPLLCFWDSTRRDWR